MHEIEAPLTDRVDCGRQARHADSQPRVEGHVEFADRRQPVVDRRVGADHLDLAAGDAALANLGDRAADAVRCADAVGEQRDAQRLGVVAAPARYRGHLALLVGQERARGRVRNHGDAGLEDALGRGEELPDAAVRERGERRLDGTPQTPFVSPRRAAVEVCVAELVGLHVLDQLALAEALEADGGEPCAQ